MSNKIYRLTPEEVARGRARFTVLPDNAYIAEVEAQTKRWLSAHGHDKPAPPLWEEMKIPKRHLRVIDPWQAEAGD